VGLIQAWEARIEQIIKENFEGIGKGWFNLDVSSKES